MVCWFGGVLGYWLLSLVVGVLAFWDLSIGPPGCRKRASCSWFSLGFFLPWFCVGVIAFWFSMLLLSDGVSEK